MQYSSHDYQNSETDPDIPGDLFARHESDILPLIEQLRYTVDNMNYRVGSLIRFQALRRQGSRRRDSCDCENYLRYASTVSRGIWTRPLRCDGQP